MKISCCFFGNGWKFSLPHYINRLIPLDSQDNQEEKLPKELLELKLKQKSFIDELMNLKNVREIDLPIKINAELRSYQTDGIKWLSFLNRYKLHGILCDDMGKHKEIFFKDI